MGANIGAFSIVASLKSNATIYAVEPENENYKILKLNTEGFDGIIPIQAGIWSHKVKLKVVPYETGFWGFTVEESEDGNVQAIGIQDLMEDYKINTIDLLKVDIEGAEVQMLSGKCAWLESVKCLIIETHDRKREGCTKIVDEKMNEFHFILKGVWGEDKMYVRKMS